MINEETIKKLNPCKESFDKALKFYKGKSFTKRQFMGLKNVTHKDKILVAFRLMPKENIRFAAADIAELVLPIYENEYPEDLRPREAIEAARKVPINNSAAYKAACAAAYDAAKVASVVAADYAASAANAAYAAAYSADIAADSIYNAYTAMAGAYSAAYAAVYSAADASANRNKIEKQIRTIILKYWK